jgi:hypothetical protein
MRGKWYLPLSLFGLALCAVLVLLFLTPSTTFAMVNTGGNFQPSGAQGTGPLSTAYTNGYRQGYQSACSGGIGASAYPAIAGNSEYNAGYQQGYQYGAGNCNNQSAVETPATTGTPYQSTGTPYNSYGGYSSPNESYTPAYGTNNAPLFNVQTNVTVSGNH